MLVSHTVYLWFVTFMVGGISLYSGTRDLILLIVQLRRGVRTPQDRDRIFGYVIGFAICAAGAGGVIKYHYF